MTKPENNIVKKNAEKPLITATAMLLEKATDQDFLHVPVEKLPAIKPIIKMDVRKVRTVAVPGGRRFRAGFRFDQAPINVDFSVLSVEQVAEIEADPYLQVAST